ncbi:MAG: 16S rRNA (cytosine(1402)-N(4))-methyltransferase RsmH [bacterium]
MTAHVPVLLQESVDNLQLESGETFLDGTIGGGGHSSLVAKTFGEKVKIIGLDRDQRAIERSGERLEKLTKNFCLVNESFRNLDKVLEGLGISSVDAILLDLGLSSDQLEETGKGFSFQRDEPLDMRMSEEGITAADILNTFSEDVLELILRGFGEERYSRRIAHEIVERRTSKPFKTTFDLIEVVMSATPASYHRGRIHPATRTFQAIRIAVNEELNALEEGLEKAFEFLRPGGRIAVISFHSLEDRIVKNFFKNLALEEKIRLVTNPSKGLRAGKPITPSEEEVSRNPRSRSAKLRVIEKNRDL